MSVADRPLPLHRRLVIGGLFAGLGLLILWLALSDPSSVNGPPWMGLAAGGVFATAGLMLATQGTPLGAWTGAAGAFLIFAGFAAIGNWIAFGPGPRACSGGISLLFLSASRGAGEVECRVAFGVGAVILDAGLVAMATGGIARAFAGQAWAAGLRRAGEWTLGLALLPLILLAVLVTTVAAGAGALERRVRKAVGRAEEDAGAP